MARLEVIRPPKLAQLFFIFLLGVILKANIVLVSESDLFHGWSNLESLIKFYLSDSHDSIPF